MRRVTAWSFPAKWGQASSACPLFIAAALATTAQAQCPPPGYDRARLDALKAAGWSVPDEAARNRLARALAPCVASPDPALRDRLAFEALQHWMRAGQLSEPTLTALADDLQRRLAAPPGPGFERPFAALALAEVARTDRLHPWMTPARRESLLDAATAYLAGVSDYRGFDERAGWRHGVAHGADLMLQLSLNPAFGRAELTRIRTAVAAQIAPAGHTYAYGEPERLAAPILYIAQRGVFTEAEWTAWLAALADPAPLPAWNAAFTTQAGIARVQNVKAFLFALFAYASLDSSPADDVLLPGTRAALTRMP